MDEKSVMTLLTYCLVMMLEEYGDGDIMRLNFISSKRLEKYHNFKIKFKYGEERGEQGFYYEIVPPKKEGH